MEGGRREGRKEGGWREREEEEEEEGKGRRRRRREREGRGGRKDSITYIQLIFPPCISRHNLLTFPPAETSKAVAVDISLTRTSLATGPFTLLRSKRGEGSW